MQQPEYLYSKKKRGKKKLVGVITRFCIAKEFIHLLFVFVLCEYLFWAYQILVLVGDKAEDGC